MYQQQQQQQSAIRLGHCVLLRSHTCLPAVAFVHTACVCWMYYMSLDSCMMYAYASGIHPFHCVHGSKVHHLGATLVNVVVADKCSRPQTFCCGPIGDNKECVCEQTLHHLRAAELSKLSCPADTFLGPLAC